MSVELSAVHLAGIKPADVRWYVLGRGWRTMPSKRRSVALYVLEEQDEQLQVPLAGNEHDIRSMMTEVLLTLAKVEHRSLEDITNDVRHPYEDVLRLRVQSKLADSGTLPLSAGLELFEGAKKLLVAAGCAAISPQAFYPRKALKPVDEFIARCQIGQTAIGSYVATVLCPPLSPVGPSLFEEDIEAPPFDRQVTETLMDGLSVLNSAVQDGSTERITNGIEHGVSADLCDALANITPPEEHSILSIELAWSPVRPKISRQILSSVRFAVPDLAFIQNAGKKLREQFERPATIRGRITVLRDQPVVLAEMRRIVEVRTTLEGKGVTVRFSLNEAEYSNACNAFRDHRDIQCSGVLRRREQSKFYELVNPSEFEVLR